MCILPSHGLLWCPAFLIRLTMPCLISPIVDLDQVNGWIQTIALNNPIYLFVPYPLIGKFSFINTLCTCIIKARLYCIIIIIPSIIIIVLPCEMLFILYQTRTCTCMLFFYYFYCYIHFVLSNTHSLFVSCSYYIICFPGKINLVWVVSNTLKKLK